MNKIMKKIQPKYYGIISALLAMLGCYLIYSYCQYLSTGKYIIMDGDLIEQYVPYIKMFIRDILEGENIWFSWNSFLGMNTSLTNAYYVLSPFNILYLIFWNVDETIITAAVIILKVGLAAYTFHLFLTRVIKCKGVKTIFLPLLYSLSIYAVLYGYLYNSWMDGFYMLPLICTFIYEADYNKKSYFKLVIAYVVMFVSQFYIAYMVGVFSFLFWLVLFFARKKQSFGHAVKKIMLYGGSVICAVGISAVILLPAFLFLIGNMPGDAQDFNNFSAQLYHIYYGLFWGNRVPMLNDYPALYCGWPILILVPLYFFNKEISKKERICAGSLVGFLCLTMVISPLYQFMHAFDFPDGFNFRYTFLLVFVLVSIACRQTMYLDKIRGRYLIFVVLVHVIAYPILEWVVGQHASFFMIRMVINIVLASAWIGIWFLQKKKKYDRKMVGLLAAMLLFVELCGNGWYGVVDNDSRLQTDYEYWKAGMQEAVDELNKDATFYRCYFNFDMIQNSDSWFGYNGINDFSSAEDYELRMTLNQLGLQSSIHRAMAYGITPPLEMLLGVKYIVDAPSLYIQYENDETYVVNENPYYLQPGFMVREEILDFEFESEVAFENVNALMSALSGEAAMCFEPFAGQIMAKAEQAEIIPTEEYILIRYDAEKDSYGMITYYIPKENVEKPVYVQFISETSIAYTNSPYLLYGVENFIAQFGLLSVSYIKQLLESEENFEVSIVMNSTTSDVWQYKEAVFYEYHEEALSQIYTALAQNQMEVEEYSDGYLKGNVTVTEDKTVLFTSIPYDEGWTVWVDGEVTEPKAVLGEAFMALELEPGYHELEFEYEAPGVKEGMIISCTSLGIYVLLAVIYTIKSRKAKKHEGIVV